jgi:hypothetical protein
MIELYLFFFIVTTILIANNIEIQHVSNVDWPSKKLQDCEDENEKRYYLKRKCRWTVF